MNQNLIQRFAQPSILIGASAILAAAAILIVFAYTSRRLAATYVHPARADITEEVDATGVVKAAESVDLSFETSGRIAYVGPPVGSHVSVGTTLASLSSADLAAQLESARATLAVQQAKLDALNAGTRPEDIAVSEAAVAGATSALAQAEQSVIESSRDGYVKSDDAIHNKVDQFFNNPRSNAPKLTFTLSDSNLQNAIESERVGMETLLQDWQRYLAGLSSDTNSVDVAPVVEKSRSKVSTLASYLDKIAAALSSLTPSAALPLATIQKYQTDVAAARAALSAAQTGLNAAETAEKAAQSALASARSALALKKAGATSQDIAAQSAQVQGAQASVHLAEAQLAKTAIRAPMNGTITGNDAHVGATAAPGFPLISINSDSQFQLESFVSEADVAKVRAGEAAEARLDAYPNDAPLPAHVVSVDPAARVQNGVSSYRMLLQFDGADARVKAGLTANIRIIAERKRGVLTVPTSAIITKGNERYVLRQGAGGDELAQIVAGISSADGRTEILSGLSESDSIRTFGAQQ